MLSTKIISYPSIDNINEINGYVKIDDFTNIRILKPNNYYWKEKKIDKYCSLLFNYYNKNKDKRINNRCKNYNKKASPAGLEPALPKGNGLAGHRVNHSAKVTTIVLQIWF
ncbi:hypothetical protein BCR32DRAFT_300616 [Anaeromyces robustus]|uniref:Uncharacterized protein n=1 Tax=Anaeromyces robustus TaxID=1754192 RepID=A0A1Y1X212_9FUNG|nr:hypothetical protein BCR32DRAFT_300616 [Anaeromyces robustus]|eukprot:ORX79847.1 hypothetical protein BCR32DRAFT_300616 [Anaeromyces robustus]